MPRLLIIHGPGKGSCYGITGETSFGRSRDNLIRLYDKSVSRNHALITKENNKFIIKDLKSRNGVLVNNHKIFRHTLKKGDQIAIGEIGLVFEPDFEIIIQPGQKGGLFIVPDKEVTTPLIAKTPIAPSLRRTKSDTALSQEETARLKLPKDSPESQKKLIEILNRRLHALYEINRVINSRPREEILDKIMETILKIFEVERGAIVFCNEAGGHPYPAMIKSNQHATNDIPLSKTILKEVLKKRQAVLSSDIAADQRFQLSQSLRFDEVKSILCAPLVSHNKLLGLIYLDTRSYLHAFEKEDLKLLVAISHQLAVAIENIRFANRLKEETKEFRAVIQDELNLIGENPQITTLLDKVRKIAPTDTTVLITGETGTGKELIARSLHHQGPRRHKPFVTVDCSAIPQTLLESELFGYEKGAFTGATRAKPGRFEMAAGGTLFLDEIGNLDLATQTKLLRVVDQKEFTRLGSVMLVSADVRIVTATNQDLKSLIKQGKFREDLFYRLAVITFLLPPLRERRSDIPLLAKYYFNKFVSESGRHITDITPKAMELLTNHPWPGNIRELRNVIERGVILCETNTITPEDLQLNISSGTKESILDRGVDISSISLPELTQQIEKEYIIKALKTTEGKKIKAAQILKISRPTLDKKIKEYGIEE